MTKLGGSRNSEVSPQPLALWFLECQTQSVKPGLPWGPFLPPPPFFLSFFFVVLLHSRLVAAGRDIIVSYAFLPEVHLSFG